MSPGGDWLPAHVDVRAAGEEVVWLHAAGARLDDPFFAQSVERLLRRPFSLLFPARTPLERLVEDAASAPIAPLAGMVAHVSRCGSTLVAQWLASGRDRLVLSEPGPLDAVLHLDLPRERHVPLLRAVVAGLSRPRGTGATRSFVKLDAWALNSLPLLREAFPDVPVVLLVRDPLEVVVSQLRMRGAHAVPGVLPPQRLGLTHEQLALPPEEFVVQVVARLTEAAARADVDLVVDHADLPARRDHLLALLGVDAAQEREALDAVSGRSAKNPVLPHVDDRSDKQRDGEHLRALVERVSGASWRQLQARL